MIKYQDLKNEVKRSWKLKNPKVVPVIVGAMGMMTKNLTEILKTIWEYYYKRTAVGSCSGFSDEPEESPRHKHFENKKLHRLIHES